MTRLAAIAALLALAAPAPAGAALTPREAKPLLVHQLERDGFRPSSTRRIYCLHDGPRGIQCDIRFHDLATAKTFCGLATISTTGPRAWAWNLTWLGCDWW